MSPPPEPEIVTDAIVVGGGAAGLAAATWIARYRRSVALLDGGEPRNQWVELAHGYLGEDPVNPADLRQRAREQLARYAEAEQCTGQATLARRREDGMFTVQTDAGLRLRSRRLVLATGVRDRFPEVERFFEHYGASVFHCPTCDGYEARDAHVVVFGWNEDITGFALTLLGWARSVTIVTDGRLFEGDDVCRRQLAEAEIPVLEDDAVELLGQRGGLEGVRLRTAGVVPCELAFFSIAHEPRTALAEQLGCRLTGGGLHRGGPRGGHVGARCLRGGRHHPRSPAHAGGGGQGRHRRRGVCSVVAGRGWPARCVGGSGPGVDPGHDRPPG